MMKRGQAAMEFLMTYGWAILAAVIVIGVLAYFGVFSPSTYVPNQCVITAPFGCNGGQAVAKTTGISFELVNGVGNSANVTNVAITNCNVAGVSVGEVADGSITLVTVPCALPLGSKFKGEVTVKYKQANSALELSSSGTIIAKVTAAT